MTFKSIKFLFIIIIATFPFNANAVALHYTFNGNVTNILINDGSITHSVGDAVSYVLLVDFDQLGYTYFNSTLEVFPDANSENDYFYTDYVSGDIEPSPYYANYAGWLNAEVNLGLNSLSSSYGQLTVGDALTIKAGLDVSDWIVGTTGTFDNLASLGWPGAGRSVGNWTLTNISPVPIPAAVWLLGSGLLGLAGFARRKAKLVA